MHLLKNFKPQAIIFDKDGTLIDFDFMWGTWTLQLAGRLQALIDLDVRQALCECYGYDMVRRKILPDGKLTCTPMWRLRELMVDVVASMGIPGKEASCAVANAWHVPEPVTLAKPFTDIQKLFTNIRRLGIKIAIATTDDRDPTHALLEAFRVQDLVTTMVCADDGIKAKPAPDMVTAICQRMNVQPRDVIVVGDTVADLQMARSAEVGYAIGVLSGVGSLANLTPLADILIDTIDTLQESFILKQYPETQRPETDEGLASWNPDPAYS
ncbi:MAG TPA: HAD family hydrolase [Anaerolineales bacterium]|jgi:haloacid dehalogenase superfamily, subfamily IA, variant 1 with third motif having Dx(3-4)D or Dx(3-4)E